ncbi:hypothetical protein GCM10027275_46130 [Rhabdobacter roseus]|uniref:histidine kinase n=1 Tax=Rhabdobacter roseus TaxID=1655419 RepID=A0A840TYU2_9BACT|nr:tetratricopeptide repeat protein [Rhabdobacter roseus]MBB5286717.1 two-component sensor histidine kinase [Rhabdobacter roseus]
MKKALLFLTLWLVGLGAGAQVPTLEKLKAGLHLPGPDSSRAYAYYDLANYYFKESRFDSARYYLAPMLPICQKAQFLMGLGYYYLLDGVLHRENGQYEKAVASQQKALSYFEKARNPRKVASMYSHLGLLYKRMGETQKVVALTEQGIAYMKKAVAIDTAIGNQDGLAGDYIHLGILYEDIRKYAIAFDYFQRALEAVKTLKNPDQDRRVIYNNMGHNLLSQHRYAEAIPYLYQALSINSKANKITSLTHNYRNLASCYSGLSQHDSALYYAEKALTLVEQSREVPLQRSVYQAVHRTYAAAGRYDEAYRYVARQKALEDSLLSLEKTQSITHLQGQYEVQKTQELARIKAELEIDKAREVAQIEADKLRRIHQIEAQAEVAKTRAVADVQTKYETQKKVQQIQELNKENALKSTQMTYLAGGLGLLLLLLGGMLLQYRMIRHTNARLSAQNAVISEKGQQLEQQSEQLRTLMKELHHRVKNNLAIVSSLLSLQSDRLTDEDAVLAVQQGQRRVEAMSLIHQRLYRTDQVASINIRDYIIDLIESLMEAYGYRADQFDLDIRVEQQELDVDLAIPLGLIMNELLTNSFKYAYHQVPRPALRVALQRENGLTLEVQDNGPGLDLGSWQSEDDTSFGKQLIVSLSEQAGGTMRVENRQGAYFQLHIPLAALAA